MNRLVNGLGVEASDAYMRLAAQRLAKHGYALRLEFLRVSKQKPGIPAVLKGLASWQGKALKVISSLVSNESGFDAQSPSPVDLVKQLRVNHAPVTEKLQDNLDKLASLGCKTFFGAEDRLDNLFHTGGPRPDTSCYDECIGGVGSRIKREAKLIQQGHWPTATWREGDKMYILALEGSRDRLRSYLL